jgi:hypothetical protein
MMAVAAPSADDIASGLGRFLLCIFLAAGVWNAFSAGRAFYNHAPREGGRWVIDQVTPVVPRGSVIVSDWMDATSLAFGAYADGTLADRIIVSGWDPDLAGLYRRWVAPGRRVFILADPKDLPNAPAGWHPYRRLDPYHQLYEANPL